ncbi:MAG TPA: glycosyltransferase [Candidatus Udaeobacter sp.]|jgi:glycosyltransferase involved in cell wall biosynthesis|nr:glycosyltransferase [Candidatus Udaeobacter sp.]
MDVSVIIPARNEARRIEATLSAYAVEFARDGEIIVVVNGSNDRSAEVARQVAAPHPHVTIIDIPEPIGKGGAVRAGFARARGNHVGFVDADMATSPAEYRRILTAAASADGAIGSRFARGSTVIGRSPLRALAGRIFILLVRGLFQLPFADTQCGAKIFHRRFLPEYLSRSHVNDLAFDVELLLILRSAKARLVEVPTVWTAQPGSAILGTPLSFVRHGLVMVRSLLRLWSETHRTPLPRGGAIVGGDSNAAPTPPRTAGEAGPGARR